MAKPPITPIDKISAANKKATKAAHESAKRIEFELVSFKTGDKSLEFNIDVTGDTVWATQQQIADLYDRDKSTINEHIMSVLREGELEESSTVRKFPTVVTNGKTYEILHYDLDMILAVGFRVKSPKASQFRKWAYQTLRGYIVDGYALNESRLRDDPASLSKLAADLRKLRADEKNIYANVREFFKLASTDYEPNTAECKKFYALLQDKFHFAITGSTASQLILSRADHHKPNMGLQSFVGNMPTIDEAKIGKNYLDGDEIYTLHILCEQFLLYVESKAIRGKPMNMSELGRKLDELLKVNDYAVFTGWKDYLRDRAIRHAQAEYAMFAVRLKKDDAKLINKTKSKP